MAEDNPDDSAGAVDTPSIAPDSQRPPPVLASEALRDELAPHQPAEKPARVWLVCVALSLACLGFAQRHGVGALSQAADSSALSFLFAASLAATALLPFPYGLRAGVTALIGLAIMGLGLGSAGPLAGLAMDGGLSGDLARLLAITLLPAALLFRAHYRAYRRARVLLAIAFALALPFATLQGVVLLDTSVSEVVRVAAGVNAVAVACSLFGFVGGETTGAGAVWAALILGVPAVDIAARELSPLAGPDVGLLAYPTTAVGLVCASIAASVGLFQLAAVAFTADARSQSLNSATND